VVVRFSQVEIVSRPLSYPSNRLHSRTFSLTRLDDSDHNQLSLILAVTGTPTLDEFYKINSRRSRDYLRALPFQKKRDFGELFPNASPAAVDFLAKTLTFDPTKRLTVEECLEHRKFSDSFSRICLIVN